MMKNNRINENVAKNSYAAYSLGAVRAERCADYPTAAKLWKKAVDVARDAHRRDWAEHRSEFCINAAAKGWGKVDESPAV